MASTQYTTRQHEEKGGDDPAKEDFCQVSCRAKERLGEQHTRALPVEDGIRLVPPHALDKQLKEVNTMAPLYTLLLCLPAALVLIACVCGLAALWSPTAQPTTHQTVGRPRGRRSTP
jgi:hypothetical protein